MNTIYRSMFAPMLLAAQLTVISQTHAGELKLPRDGWASWQVAAVDNAPAWCCWSSFKQGNSTRVACRLDERAEGYGTRDGDLATDAVKIYARVAAGKIDRLQVLAASCPVETSTPIQVLDNVATDDSARWLMARTRQTDANLPTNRPLAERALAALAMHRGDLPRDALAGIARDDADIESRKLAVFWLAMLRGNEGADITSSVMFGDKEAEVRKHAAFAISQSKSARVIPDLIRLGNSDKVGDVRAQAWFWLAHTAASETEQAIAAALRKDADEDVREQAIFALSQLPGERATRALITAAEDRSLPLVLRKRAVFWLSQSESVAALAYMDRVLALR